MKSLSYILNPLRIKGNKLPESLSIKGVSQKADSVQSGQAFFAIRGTQVDGHTFIQKALDRGAAVVVVDNEEAFKKYPQTVWVDCTRSQLAEAASAWFDHPTEKFSLVGVTGTNGKTTSSYLLREIWENIGLKTGMVGTVETLIGKEKFTSTLTTPGALELQGIFSKMVDAQVTHAVMEVSSIALDQKRVGGCHFKVGLFTNFTQDHLDYHGTFENYFEAKLKLFRDFGLPLAVLNLDDEWVRRVLVQGKAKQTLSFSLSDPSADFYAENIHFSVSGTTAKIKTPSGHFDYRSSLIGAHNLANGLGALATIYGLGQDFPHAVRALEKAQGAPGRLERVMQGEKYPSIFVDYAHTDDALRRVLEALRKLKNDKGSGKIITVFGCGGDRDKTKRPKMAEAASSLSDITVVTSDNPRTENPEKIIEDICKGLNPGKSIHCETLRKKAIEWALSQANPQDVVLVAGKGHETYQIIGTTQFPFDDRQVVRDYYKS